MPHYLGIDAYMYLLLRLLGEGWCGPGQKLKLFILLEKLGNA